MNIDSIFVCSPPSPLPFLPTSHINEDKRKTEGQKQIFDVVYEVDGCPVSVFYVYRERHYDVFHQMSSINCNKRLFQRHGINEKCHYLFDKNMNVSGILNSGGN